MSRGVVKWYNDLKGYGFAKTPDGRDVFVHYTAIVGEGFKTVSEGQHVEFDLLEGPKGPQAMNLVKLSVWEELPETEEEVSYADQ